MHWHFIGTRILLSWVTFFKTYKAAFLAIWTTLLKISWDGSGDTLKVTDEGIMFNEVLVTDHGFDLIITIHLLWTVLFVINGSLILACFADDLDVVIIWS